MNNLDKQYQQLLQDILDNGLEKKDRTGTGTLSVFGRQIRHKMSEGFPLLTTKKMHFKSITTELLWFLRGDTNIKFLLDYDCHIWNGDAYKNYLTKCESRIQTSFIHTDMYICIDIDDSRNNIYRPYSQEEFINKIKINDEFAKKWGELGPIYGAQWRSWKYQKNEWYDGKNLYEEESKSIDQIQNLINELKTNPDSRRLMVSSWNVGQISEMVLPPCHYGFQVYTRELSMSEKELWYKNNNINPNEPWFPDFPTRAISLMWNQRSVDTFLGLPFNIASYGLLLEIIAKEVNMVPDELIGNLGDVHLYKNHIEQAKEQIGRKYTPEERLELLKEAMGNKPFSTAVEELMPFGGGLSEYYDMHKIPYDTKESYPLPSVRITERNWYQHELVKEHLGEKTFSEKIMSYRPDCFELVGYQSHPKIKAPLSN